MFFKLHLSKHIYLKVVFEVNDYSINDVTVRGKPVELGDMLSVYFGNGIRLCFRCEYNTTLTLGPESFNIETTSVFGKNHGFGNLAPAFTLSLSSFDKARERYIMGSLMEVAIAWSAPYLADFTFSINTCSVLHGDIAINIIKERVVILS